MSFCLPWGAALVRSPSICNIVAKRIDFILQSCLVMKMKMAQKNEDDPEVKIVPKIKVPPRIKTTPNMKTNENDPNNRNHK